MKVDCILVYFRIEWVWLEVEVVAVASPFIDSSPLCISTSCHIEFANVVLELMWTVGKVPWNVKVVIILFRSQAETVSFLQIVIIRLEFPYSLSFKADDIEWNKRVESVSIEATYSDTEVLSIEAVIVIRS